MALLELPIEIQLQIFRHFHRNDLLKLRCCSKACHDSVAIKEIACAAIHIPSHLMLKASINNSQPPLELISQYTRVLSISGMVEEATEEEKNNVDANCAEILQHCNAFNVKLSFAPSIAYKKLVSLTHLLELRLHGPHQLQNEDLRAICSCLSQLQVFSLNNGITYMELQREWGVRRKFLSATLQQHGFSEILKLGMLRELYLTNCPVVDLKDIAVPSLRKLSLSVCEQLSNDTFHHFNRLLQLNELTINSQNEFDLSDAALRRLVGIPSLDKLCLRNCWSWSAHTITELIYHFSTLRKLELEDSNISDMIVTAISSHMTSLENLNIALCPHLTDAALVALSSMSGLKNLNISCVVSRSSLGQYTDAGFSALLKLKQLQVLIAQGLSKQSSGVTGEAYAQLCGLPALRELHVGFNPFTNENMVHFAQMTQLHVLDLQQTGMHITDDGLLCLQNLDKLKKLNLYRIRRITKQGLSLLQSKLPNCEIIWAEGARNRWKGPSAFGEH